MARKAKLLARLKQRPKDFTWDEVVSLLKLLGFEPFKGRKTGGSRHRFVHSSVPPIVLHRPHPGNTVKGYVINDLLGFLRQEGML